MYGVSVIVDVLSSSFNSIIRSSIFLFRFPQHLFSRDCSILIDSIDGDLFVWSFVTIFFIFYFLRGPVMTSGIRKSVGPFNFISTSEILFGWNSMEFVLW